MARTRAVLRTDMWGDDDWRALTPGAQWLYEHLLTSASLTQIGRADWRPKRIAKMARGLNVEQVERYAAELSAQRFILIDDETEEVLVRSFLRHDEPLKNPNLWKSIGSAFAEIASPTLREAVAVEAARLRQEAPDGYAAAKGGTVFPWSSAYLRTMLKAGSTTPSHTPPETPSETPSREVARGTVPSTPAPAPTPEASLPPAKRKPEVKLPASWSPTTEHVKRATEKGLNLLAEAEAFRLHAETHDRRAANWNAAFTTWLMKAKPSPAAALVQVAPKDEWMLR